jgi:hypothetical protein
MENNQPERKMVIVTRSARGELSRDIKQRERFLSMFEVMLHVQYSMCVFMWRSRVKSLFLDSALPVVVTYGCWKTLTAAHPQSCSFVCFFVPLFLFSEC